MGADLPLKAERVNVIFVIARDIKAIFGNEGNQNLQHQNEVGNIKVASASLVKFYVSLCGQVLIDKAER